MLFLFALTFTLSYIIPVLSHYKFSSVVYFATEGKTPVPDVIDSLMSPFVTLRSHINVLMTPRSVIESDIFFDDEDEEEEFLAKQEAETAKVTKSKKETKH